MQIYSDDNMDYSSASEGEIVETRGTKATTTHTSGRGQKINGHDRPRSHISGSARPNRNGHDSDGLDYDDRSLSSGPGTPERRRHDQAPHGVKRRFPEDDKSERDARRFKVHYEEGRSREDAYGHEGRSNGGRGRDARDRYDRRTYNDARDPRYGDLHEYDSRSAPSKERSELGHAFDPATKYKSTEHDRSRGALSSKSREVNDSESETSKPETTADSRYAAIYLSEAPQLTSLSTIHSRDNKDDDNEPSPAMDEAALIEQRRKRREALRAKHTRETPLVQKVLQANASTTTPGSAAASVSSIDPVVNDMTAPISPRSTAITPTSPQPTSPSTPQVGSPRSPFEISVTNDAELAKDDGDHNGMTPEADGPSAADYDPSMDMEDTLRQKDVNPLPSDLHQQSKETPKRAAKRDKGDDDDEFDMFVDDVTIESPEATAKREDDGIQAVSDLKGKQLDQSMLDDWDDPEGYYRIILGELLDKRYQVQSNLGKGVFSAVVRATDNKTGNTVAIKVIRKQESMFKAGLKEIHTLEKLGEADPEDKRHVIRLERHFMHKGHLCMVFENLSINLREVLKKFGRDVGINIKAVRAYAQQIFLGLSLMKKCDIIHADLKPDNVLVNENRSQLKIADLGSAFDVQDSEVTDMLVSRFYRAPEIMLGVRGDFALDMWSIGCTLFELYTGRICFAASTNNQMLKAIMECRGKIPNRVLKKAEYWDQHFEQDGTFLSQEYDSVTRKDVIRRIPIVRPIQAKEIRARVFASSKNLSIADTKELNLFSDLLEKCLAVDPARRITPNEALRHGFINRSSVPSVPAMKGK